jgi:hypothetical protein
MIQKKFENLHENTLEQLKNANNVINDLQEQILKLKQKENFLNEKNKNYEQKKSIVEQQEKFKRGSLFSNSKTKFSQFKEQNNLTSELLEKICKLENKNKKLIKLNKFLNQEIDELEQSYKNELEIIYSIAVYNQS